MSSCAQDNVCIKIGVTAHRDLSYADTDSIRHDLVSFFSSLQQRFPDLPITLINSLAEGGDTLIAQVADELGISLEVPLPMSRALYEADFSSPEALAEFQHYCAKGDTFELPVADENLGQDIAHPGTARDTQYAQLGMYIAEHCHILLALWDGVESEEPGGTASVVNYMLNDIMPGLAPENAKQRLLADKESDLVYHLHCPRQQGETTRSGGRWLSNQSSFDGLAMPQRYSTAFLHMQEFRKNILRQRETIDHEGETLAGITETGKNHQLAVINDLFRCADWLALKYRKLVVRELLVTHVLAGLMGCSFIAYSDLFEANVLLYAFLFFFFTAWFVNFIANARQWHRKYLDNRALAEGLRVQFYWCMANVEGIQGAAFTYDNLMQKQDVELVWIRHVMRAASRPVTSPPPDGDGLALAIGHWIGEEGGKAGQLGYYRQSFITRLNRVRRNEFYGRITLWVGIAIAFFLAVNGGQHGERFDSALLVMMGLLPLLVGIREAYAFKKADKELVKQYQFMFKTFSKARERLQGTENTGTREAILRALGEACLEEHSEWILLHRQRPLEHAGIQG